jgi:hypothetical protein
MTVVWYGLWFMAGSFSSAHKPLTRPQILSYSVGHVINDTTCCWYYPLCLSHHPTPHLSFDAHVLLPPFDDINDSWFTYLLLVLQKVHHMSEFNGGLVLLIGQVPHSLDPLFVNTNLVE